MVFFCNIRHSATIALQQIQTNWDQQQLSALSLRNFWDALFSQKKTHTHWTQSKNLFLELNTKVCEYLYKSSLFKSIKHFLWLLILSAVNWVVKFLPAGIIIEFIAKYENFKGKFSVLGVNYSHNQEQAIELWKTLS